MITTIPTPQFKAVVLQHGLPLLDVRTPEEYQAGHIPSAINVDYYAADFRDQYRALGISPSTPIAIYCRSGKRSLMAADIITQELGHRADIYDLEGGYIAYSSEVEL